MKLSKTSEYALRVLSYMVNSDKEVFSAKFLVETLQVPDKYLRRLMTDLSKKGLIKSVQGRDGGYIFAKNPNDIYISQVIDAVEGIYKYEGCLMGFNDCGNENPCSLHQDYAPIKEQLLEFLSTTSLAEIRNEGVLKF